MRNTINSFMPNRAWRNVNAVRTGSRRNNAVQGNGGVNRNGRDRQQFAVVGKPALLECFHEHDEESDRPCNQQAGFEHFCRARIAGVQQPRIGLNQELKISADNDRAEHRRQNHDQEPDPAPNRSPNGLPAFVQQTISQK
jgi:hypothetical protein